MDDVKIAKIDRFLKDEVMVMAVYEVLRNAFLKGKGQRDINILAAERLAVDLLDEGWRDLKKFQDISSDESEHSGNVGL